jgi:hypothetical protein
LDEFTNKRIHRDHAFGLQLAEWHMNGPLIRARGAEAIAGQIGAFPDAHAGVANQQKSVAAQIVAPEELLLQELILLCSERTRESLRETRNVLAADQMSEVGKLFRPSQFIEDAAQMEEQVDTGCRRQRRRLRAEAGHPAEDVWLTAQLLEGVHLGMIGAQIVQEVAGGPTVVTSSVGMERSAEGIDSLVEDRGQPMLERRASRVHDEVTGSGRMCWATARAY